MTTLIGTAYFVTRADAIEYYELQGIGADEVERKLADGEIFIGKPPHNVGDKLWMIDGASRWAIEEKAWPTTLADIAPNGGVVHVYAEFRGSRYYIGSDPNYHGARKIAEQYRVAYPNASIYLADKSDSTSINGAKDELAAAYHAALKESAS